MMTYGSKIFETYVFSKLSRHLGDMIGYHDWSCWASHKIEKIKIYLFLKLFIDLWAIIWHHH